MKTLMHFTLIQKKGFEGAKSLYSYKVTRGLG